MKTSFTIIAKIGCLLYGAFSMYAQTGKIPDTIYANDHEQVALFFPNPISQAVTGTSRMVFTYNKEMPQYFGLLQSKKGPQSNLLVIDSAGNVFSFVLVFKEGLSRFNYFLTAADAIETEAPEVVKKDKGPGQKPVSPWKDIAGFLKKNARGNLRKEKTSSIVMRVKEVIFHEEHYFLVMEIENKSSINYRPQDILFYKATKTQGKRKSMQQLPLKILGSFDIPENIRAGNKRCFVIVIPKFTLSRDEELQIRLFEKNGARNIRLKLFQKHLDKVTSM